MTDETYHKILEYFKDVSKNSKWTGHLFAVGGCVRDEILGSEIKDVDIAVDLPNGGVEFAKWLHKKRQVIGMPTYFHKFGTAKLRLRRFPDEEIELVQTRAEKYTKKTSRCPEVVCGTLKDDCFRRDFTVNTLYRNIETGEILDMTGRGIHDIKAGIIRTPMDPYETFDDDPVRILRCLRFAARFGWEIEEGTMEALRRSVDRLNIVSRERWAAEFQKMLFGRNIKDSLGMLEQIGGLRHMNSVMREMDAKREDKSGKSLLRRGIDTAVRMEEAGIDDHSLRLAAFFHEIGKLRTGVRDRHGKMRYPRHEITGSNMAAKLLHLMKVDRDTVEATKSLILAQGVTASFGDWAEDMSDRELRKLQYSAGTPERFEKIITLVEACEADNKTTVPPGPGSPDKITRIRRRTAEMLEEGSARFSS